jgi:hypothetical protein
VIEEETQMNKLRVVLSATALVAAGMLALPALAVAAPQPADGVGTAPTTCATAQAALAFAETKYQLDENDGAGNAVLAADRGVISADYLLVIRYCG